MAKRKAPEKAQSLRAQAEEAIEAGEFRSDGRHWFEMIPPEGQADLLDLREGYRGGDLQFASIAQLHKLAGQKYGFRKNSGRGLIPTATTFGKWLADDS